MPIPPWSRSLASLGASTIEYVWAFDLTISSASAYLVSSRLQLNSAVGCFLCLRMHMHLGQSPSTIERDPFSHSHSHSQFMKFGTKFDSSHNSVFDNQTLFQSSISIATFEFRCFFIPNLCPLAHMCIPFPEAALYSTLSPTTSLKYRTERVGEVRRRTEMCPADSGVKYQDPSQSVSSPPARPATPERDTTNSGPGKSTPGPSSYLALRPRDHAAGDHPTDHIPTLPSPNTLETVT